MANQTLSLKLEVNPSLVDDIKRSLYQDISEAVQAAYEEGWFDGNSEGMTDLETDWARSDTKQKLDNLLKS